MNEQQSAAILNGLKTAIRAEFEGYHFYLLAAQNTPDEKGQSAFRQLAMDEFDHMNFLQAQADKLLKSEEIDTGLQLKKIEPFDGENPIFSSKIKDRLKDAHYEMTVLSVGIQLELNAMNTYKILAAEANDTAVARFYLDLAAFENSHYTMLLAQQNELHEAYWEANQFHPF